jgi:signal transduction histidine kinase
VNRALDAIAVLLTAGLLHVWMSSVKTMEAQARLLGEKNADLLRHEKQIARQLTELERRRNEAEEASLRKTQLLASASHDIRTPVHAINLMAEVIRRTAQDPTLFARIPSLAQRLQANALALVELVSAMLDTAYFESGRIEYHESVFSLNELLTSHCRDLLPVAQLKSLPLRLDLPEQTIWMRTDRAKLGRITSNLLTNAIKFTEKGDVTVDAALDSDGAVLIRVRDTGTGMTPEQLAGIFGEFVQVGRSGADSNDGWGLGLAICRRLIDLLGGTIDVESQLNHGSAFTVRLPPERVANGPVPGRHDAL